jgi:putative sterol carrier protein
VSSDGSNPLSRFVRSAGDRRLERTLGSRFGLWLLFVLLARRLDPARAAGFAGVVQIDLRTIGGTTRAYTFAISDGRARAFRGPANDPRVTVRAGLADFLRMATGQLNPGKALLTGRLDFRGDFRAATKIAGMFGAPSLF